MLIKLKMFTIRLNHIWEMYYESKETTNFHYCYMRTALHDRRYIHRERMQLHLL